jgi:protein transport protein SEC61 subunit alpha
VAGRFLRLFKPLSRFLPEVSSPERGVRFNEKLFWTGIALVLYLIMAEVPLYGIGAPGGPEFTPIQVIFATNQNSLMALGIGPIVTAGLILQLLAGSGIIGFESSNPDDRGLFTTASKFFSIVMTGIQASAYLIGGFFGSSVQPGVSIIIFAELMVAGIILMLLDEMIQKGWGIGSGISLFILAGVAKSIVWDSISTWGPMQDGKYYGALVAYVQTAINREPLLSNFFIRSSIGGEQFPYLPSMLGFIATILVFIVVIYVEGVRVELPVSYAGYRGFRSRYPIKLLYVSNLPVIFASALFANVYFISQLLWKNFEGNFWVGLLGTYNIEAGQYVATGGLAYFMMPPRNLFEVMNSPLQATVYAVILVAFCIVFSLTWLEVGGLDPRTVAGQLVSSGMQIPGFRRSQKAIELILKRYIPAVTVLGGALVGLIAAVASFFGVFGTGMGVLLSVGILYQYYQLLMQERIIDMYPAMRHIIGT